MSNIGPIASKETKRAVIQNSWNYIHENFHKFNEANKIKVVLTIIGKDMPNKIEGDLIASKIINVIYAKEKNDRVEHIPKAIPRELPKE